MSNEVQNGSVNVIRNTSPKLTKLSITNWNLNETYDLRFIFTELNIYSSIDGVFASGDVTINEQGNLISSCPIDGREFIEVEFCSLEGQYEPYHRIFFVYAVDKLFESRDSRSYTIRFTDVLGKINLDMRLSIKYEDKIENILKQIEEIIENPEMGFEDYKQILNNHDTIPTKNRMFPLNDKDDLYIETEYEMKCVVPSWHPVKFINYMVDRALSKDSTSIQEEKFTDCLFFQNRKGEYILTNYKKMFNTQLETEFTKNIEFKKEIANLKVEKGGFSEVKYAVQRYDLSKIFNDQIQKQIGFFGFTDFITNFVEAKCEPVKVNKDEIQSCIYNYGLSLKEQYPYETIKKTEESVYYYDTCGMNTEIYDREYDRFTLPHLKGQVIRSYLENAKITIEMNGVSDIDIGKFVYIDLGKADDNSVTQYVNGTKWVISKYAHRFLSDGTYNTMVECFTPYINRERDANHTQAERQLREGNDAAVAAQNSYR